MLLVFTGKTDSISLFSGLTGSFSLFSGLASGGELLFKTGSSTFLTVNRVLMFPEGGTAELTVSTGDCNLSLTLL